MFVRLVLSCVALEYMAGTYAALILKIATNISHASR
jgi:hypothetical protein